MRLCATVMCAGSVVACAELSETSIEDTLSDEVPCLRGERPNGSGGCIAAGIQDDGCPAGQTLSAEGSCVPAGIPADRCAPGFEAGDRACRPILPSTRCRAGSMAVPGDASCRDVSPCGTGPFAEGVAAPSTQYVDASYLGATHNGSLSQPWATIQQAVFAADPGAVVAIAAGSYSEDVEIWNKPVKLRGLCATLVEIKAVNTGIKLVGAHDAEISDVSIVSEQDGIFVSGSNDVLLERVWIHDVTSRGLNVEYTAGDASVTLRGSLIENAHQLGVFVAGVATVIETSVIRDTQSRADGTGGRGVQIQARTDITTRADVTIRGSVLDGNHHAGVWVEGSDLLLEGSVVRETLSAPAWGGGTGVAVVGDPGTGERSNAIVTSSYVDANLGMGVGVLGADASIETSVVRATLPNSDGHSAGLAAMINPQHQSNIVMRASVVEDIPLLGITLAGAHATIDSVLVRNPGQHASTVGIDVRADPVRRPLLKSVGCEVLDTLHIGLMVNGADAEISGILIHSPGATLDDGTGLTVQEDTATAQRGALKLIGSRIEHVFGSGLNVFGGDADVDGMLIADIEMTHDGFGATGVGVLHQYVTGAPSTLHLRHSRIERTRAMSVLDLGGDVTVEKTVLRDIRTRPEGTFGDGVTVMSWFGGALPESTVPFHPASATLLDVWIENAARCGLAAFAAPATVEATTFECNTVDLNGEDLLDDASGLVTFSLEDRGANNCGCRGAERTCRVSSEGLEPPVPVGQDAP